MPWDSRITLRGDKGSPLTHEELDINFKNFFYSASREGSILSLFRSTSLDQELQIPFEAPVGRNFSVQLKSGNAVSGSSVFFTGSNDFRFDWDQGLLVTTGSGLFTQDLRVHGDIIATGSVRAAAFITDIVSSSVSYKSGSNKFGDTADDIHSFTGSVNISGSTNIGTDLAHAHTMTGSFNINASGHTNRINTNILSHTGSFRNLGSIQQTGGHTREGSYTSRGNNLIYYISHSGALGIYTRYTNNALIYGNQNYYSNAINVNPKTNTAAILTVQGDVQVTRNGKIRNSYAVVGDLPSAATYRGNFGYLESSGSFIGANGTKYVEIAETSHLLEVSSSIVQEISASEARLTSSLSSDIAAEIDALSGSLAIDISSSMGGSGAGFPFSGSDSAPAEITGSLIVSGGSDSYIDFTDVAAISGSIFSGSFVGDGSGLTGIQVDEVATVSDTFTNVTTYTVNHNFDSKDVIVSVYEGDDVIYPDSITTTDLDNVTITFASQRTGRVVVGKAGHIVSGATEFADITNAPTLISSSVQAAAIGFAVTASNHFKQSQYVTGSVEATVDIVAYATSDKRLKENIEQITSSLQIVSSLTGYKYDWKQEAPRDGSDYGVIAQDVEQVLPLAVKDREDGYKGVRYEKLVPVLINAINELKAEVEELKSRL